MKKRQMNNQAKNTGRASADGGSGNGREEQRVSDPSDEFHEPIDDSAYPSDEFLGMRARMSSF